MALVSGIKTILLAPVVAVQQVRCTLSSGAAAAESDCWRRR